MRGEFIDVGGERLYYYAAGVRGAGVPVVFLHGFPTSSRLWHAVVRDFPPGHRLVVVDLPGYGRSDPPHAGSGCQAHADAVIALLDELRIERTALVGHGLGGAVAQAVALTDQQRISHLALVSSAAFGVTPRRFARLARTVRPVAKLLSPALLAGLVHGGVKRGFADPERSRLTLDTCLQPFTTPIGRDALAANLRAIGADGSAAHAPALGELTMPTAILWGDHDPFYPLAHGRRLHDAILGSTFAVIPDARHFVPEDAPDAVISALGRLLARS